MDGPLGPSRSSSRRDRTMARKSKAKVRKRTAKDLAPRAGKGVKGGAATRKPAREEVYFTITLTNPTVAS